MQKSHLDKNTYRRRIGKDLFIYVRPDEHIQEQLFWYGQFEENIANLIGNMVQEYTVFVDLGANIGYFTLLAAKKCSRGKVISFEPIGQLYEQLLRNIHENKLTNVMPVQAAVGDARGNSIMYISGEHNMGMSSLRAPENYSGRTESVKLERLEEWWAESNLPKPDIIKIDVEGSELSALKGMIALLNQHKPSIIIELNPATLSYFNLHTSDILNFLTKLDYLAYEITSKGLLKKYGMHPPETETNLVFVHPAREPEIRSLLIE